MTIAADTMKRRQRGPERVLSPTAESDAGAVVLSGAASMESQPPFTLAALCRKAQSGFTFLEVQVAMLLLLIGIMGIVLHGAAQRRHLAWISEYGKARGIVNLVASRAVLTYTEDDNSARLPECTITLLATASVGAVASAEVRVARTGP